MADLNLPENPFETIPPEEENEIKELVDLTVKLLAKRYTAPNPSLRGVHPKSHGCVQATFEVNRDLRDCHRTSDSIYRYLRQDLVVPFSMEGIAFNVECGDLFIGDLEAGRVEV